MGAGCAGLDRAWVPDSGFADSQGAVAASVREESVVACSVVSVEVWYSSFQDSQGKNTQ